MDYRVGNGPRNQYNLNKILPTSNRGTKRDKKGQGTFFVPFLFSQFSQIIFFCTYIFIPDKVGNINMNAIVIRRRNLFIVTALWTIYIFLFNDI